MLFNTYEPWKFAFSKNLSDLNLAEKDSWGIIGIPFDSTTSYHPGARFGPIVVREASYGFECFNTAFNKKVDTTFYDFGDSNVIPGNCKKTIDIVESNINELKQHCIKPILIGGEHSVSLGAINCLKKYHDDLTIVHLDAHRDLANDLIGEKYSHGTIMRRVYELGIDSLIQIGIRSSSDLEEKFACSCDNIKTFKSNQVKRHIDNILYYLSQIETPIYLTIDMDVFDFSIAPHVGNPIPSGILMEDMEYILECLSLKNIVGMDVVETSTDRLGDITAISASKIIYDFLSLI